MVYQYNCAGCSHAFEVIKSVRFYDSEEKCPKCDSLADRRHFPQKIHLSGTAVQDSYFSHALGQVVKGDTHARAIAKQNGLVEVGNERVEKHVKPELHSLELD